MESEQSYRELLKHISSLEQQYSLQELNPLRAGGTAEFFAVVHNTVELASAVKGAMDANVPYIVIGRAEGILFSDGGFPGLVIQNLSASYAIAADKSQIVVDSGLSLSQFITLTAGRSLGGLTHLYGEPGTVGGAVYANLSDGVQPILSSVRYLTMLIPPARLDKEATISRYKSDWLAGDGSMTHLQHLRATKSLEVPQPVILTVLFQLTSVRADEIQNRLHAQLQKRPAVEGMGPIFATLPDTDVEHLLMGSGISSLRVQNVFPDRYHPNFLRSKGPARSADIRQLVEEIQAKVASMYGVQLVCRYEFAGVW